MDSYTLITKETSEELLNAQAHIWKHVFSYHVSMSLKCAMELGIPETIHRHGKPMTLHDLATSLGIFPTKISSLYRVLRLLVHSHFFTVANSADGKEVLYDNNLNSRLLLENHPCSQLALMLGPLDPVVTELPQHLSTWLKSEEESVFHIAHGKSVWEHAATAPKFNEHFNKAMAADADFVSKVLLGNDEFKRMLKRVKNLVDVAGGNGTMAKAIAQAYPGVNCTVLDLPQVIEGSSGNNMVSNLEFVAGDMFKHIPSADTVILKWILHDWNDTSCIKILEKCKEAISNKGKIIIIDMVVNMENEKIEHQLSAQLLLDMQMMTFCVQGKERTQDEWKNMLLQAGLTHYKIFPILGVRSVIEVSCF